MAAQCISSSLFEKPTLGSCSVFFFLLFPNFVSMNFFVFDVYSQRCFFESHNPSKRAVEKIATVERRAAAFQPCHIEIQSLLQRFV